MPRVAALVWKDIVAARLVLAIALPMYLLQLWSMRTVIPAYLIVVTVFGGLFAFGSIVLEETQRTERLWLSLPVSRSEIVLARYVSTSFGLALALVPAWLFARDFVLPLVAQLFVFALSASVFLPAYFRWGAGRALQISALAWLVISLPLGLAGSAWWGPLFALALGLAALPVFALSGVVAAKLYETNRRSDW